MSKSEKVILHPANPLRLGWRPLQVKLLVAFVFVSGWEEGV